MNVANLDHLLNEDENVAVTQTNLVSDGFVPAQTIDPNLINPWGVSYPPTGPFWVSDNNSGAATNTPSVVTIYTSAGTPVTVDGHTAITIAPPPGQTTSAPTGQVFNVAGSGFDISNGTTKAPSVFIFATEDGTISGWNPAVNGGSSVIAVDNSNNGAGAVYKGLAIAKTDDGTFLFAANFRNGTVDVFNQQFKQVNSFTDPRLRPGFAPFNVQVLDGHLFVSLPSRTTPSAMTSREPAMVSWMSLIWRGICYIALRPRVSSILHGALRSRPRASESSLAICWSATSATAPSMFLIPMGTTIFSASYLGQTGLLSSSAISGR
jgi:hypothetical protein